jgi:histidyl-tRNA synthetase
VRGLDYYTRTTFSFVCDRLGAQSEIGGGGRYDGLVEQLGGPATPAVGWAAGIERILLALEGEHERETAESDVFIVAESEDDRRTAATLAAQLRRVGISAQVDLAGRGLKGQLKHVGRVGAQHVLRLTDGALSLPDVPAESTPRPDQLIEIIELLGRGIGADRDE